MICNRCKTETAVVDTRQTTDGVVRRRRECSCGRFTTYELRDDAIEHETITTTRLAVGIRNGRLMAWEETDFKFLCECGNEARYSKKAGAAPRYCGLCDMLKNEAKGIRR